MKTFTAALLLAAFASAKELPDMDMPIDVAGDSELSQEEINKAYWENFNQHMYLLRKLWLGVFQGLYGVSSEVEAPTKECFGTWIPEKMQEIGAFKNALKESWMVDMDMAATAAYDIVDLTFLNDKYCHFRHTMWDLHTYCSQDGACAMSGLLEHMQTNAFSIIT